ncbi:MAG: HTTM domain-containing protein [Proteobacteria bacterium]|nr:HTTM domain-containing protein [Pseudomonadota bacterium]
MPRLGGAVIWGRGIVRRTFEIDPRSLAVFRIGLGLLLLLDLYNRAQDLTAHYTDHGLLPRGTVLEQYGQVLIWPLHMANGSVGGQYAIFLLAALAAFSLLVGYRTRLVTVLSWILLLSLQRRNYMLTNSGDAVFRLLLFWSMFLPLGLRFSVDSLRLRRRPTTPVVGVASAALLLQVAFIYWFAALLKTGTEWHEEGTAIFYALSIDQLATSLAPVLLQFNALLEPLTRAVWWFELLGPFLAFLPFWQGPARTLAVVLFVGMHLGFAIFLEIGLFPFVCMVAWLPFVPPWAWQRISGVGVEARLQIEFLANALASRLRGFAARTSGALRMLGSASLALLLAYVFLWNLAMVVPSQQSRQEQERTSALGYVLGLEQRWKMFAPSPLRMDGWYVVPGELADGSRVDVFRDGAPLSWDKPESVSALYSSQRWRKYMMNLSLRKQRHHRPLFLDYLCRSWNSSHPEEKRLLRLDLIFMREETLERYRTAPAVPVLLNQHECEVAADGSGEQRVAAASGRPPQ